MSRSLVAVSGSPDSLAAMPAFEASTYTPFLSFVLVIWSLPVDPIPWVLISRFHSGVLLKPRVITVVPGRRHESAVARNRKLCCIVELHLKSISSIYSLFYVIIELLLIY